MSLRVFRLGVPFQALEIHAGELAVLDDEALRRVIDDDLDAFFFGVLQFPGRGFEESARAAGHHFMSFAPRRRRRPAAVHGGVADADDQDFFADRIGMAEGDRFQPVDADVDMRSVSWRPGMSSSLPRGAPVPTKIASKPCVEQRPHAVRRASCSGCRRPYRGWSISSSSTSRAGGKPGCWCASGRRACRICLENHDFVAERHQVVGDGERCGTGADAARRACRFSSWNLRQQVCDFAAQVGRDAFQAADGDGLVHPGGRGGRQARTDDRRCAPECRETRSIRGSACRRRCSGPARSGVYIRGHWCGRGRPTGNRRLYGSSSDCERR